MVLCYLVVISGCFSRDSLLQAKAKRKNDMTLEDMYNTPYDFDEDEDEDSDWEPFENHHVVEIAKWFCVNCTIFNLDNFDHCNVSKCFTQNPVFVLNFY